MTPIAFPFGNGTLVVFGEFRNAAARKELIYPFLAIRKGRLTYDGMSRQYLLEPGVAIGKDNCSNMDYYRLHAIPNNDKHDFYKLIGTSFMPPKENGIVRAWLEKTIFDQHEPYKSLSEGDEFYICITIKQERVASLMDRFTTALQGMQQSRRMLSFPKENRLWFGGSDYTNYTRGEVRKRLQQYHDNFLDISTTTIDSDLVAKRKNASRRTLPLKLRRTILERDGYKCADCGRSPRTDSICVLHIDHRIPLAKGGTNDEANLQTLCDWCNLGKGIDVDWKLNQAC